MVQTRRMVVAAVGVCTALCLGARAQQLSPEPAPIAPSANATGVLSETERELQAISALPHGLSDARTGPATLALPALQAPVSIEAPAPARLSPKDQQRALDELRRQRAARNWLLDAMRSRESGQPADPAKAKQERDEALAALLFRTGDASADDREPTLDVVSEALRAADEAASREMPERTGTVHASNPLETFLSAWMTPRDFALLGPGSASEPNAVPDRSHSMPLPGVPPGPVDVPIVTENPYLQHSPVLGALQVNGGSLDVPWAVAPSHSDFAPTSGVPAPAGPASVGGLITPEGSGKSPPETRYQPPPSVDQKYFPQLKRF